jgi:hypothetical protein
MSLSLSNEDELGGFEPGLDQTLRSQLESSIERAERAVLKAEVYKQKAEALERENVELQAACEDWR